MGYIDQGKKEGATLHSGGNALSDGKDGYFIEVSSPVKTCNVFISVTLSML